MFLGKKTIFGSHKKKKALGLRSRKFSKILARQLSYTFHFHTKQILIRFIFNKRYLEHGALNISDIAVRARDQALQRSPDSHLYIVYITYNRLWHHKRDFSELRATKIHSRTIRSSFQESRECGLLLNSPKRAWLRLVWPMIKTTRMIRKFPAKLLFWGQWSQHRRVRTKGKRKFSGYGGN